MHDVKFFMLCKYHYRERFLKCANILFMADDLSIFYIWQ